MRIISKFHDYYDIGLSYGIDKSLVYVRKEIELKQDDVVSVPLLLFETKEISHLSKVNLMNELTKIKRVVQKFIEDAPQEVLLILDGSTGQNAFIQAREFTKATEVTSIAITKLDGTAKGGVVIGISDEFKIPVKYIGIGEKIDDLQVFNKLEFVDSLFKSD